MALPVDDCSGRQVSIYEHELKLLRLIAERTSDYLYGLRDAEFARLNGGIEQLRDSLFEASKAHLSWINEFEY